jgi:hypothetical protein
MVLKRMVFKRIATQLQVDKPLVYAMAARIWQAFSGPITIVFLIRSLTLSEQGVYYALVSIVGIQMFFELGLLNILVSQAGHEFARLSAVGSQRMRELIRSSRRWFGVAAMLFTITAIGFGWITLANKGAGLDWQAPLVVMILASGATVAISPGIAILEGVGFREDVYRLRCVQMISGNVVVWLALSLGLKIWALVLSACVQCAWAAYLVFVLHRAFFINLAGQNTDRAKSSESEFSWTRDVAPVQWRLALISAVYHFATQFFTVIVLRYHSEAEAGRLGMTLSVTGAIQSMALAWVHTKFSLASLQHGSGKREAAGTMWRRTAVVSTALLMTALTSAIAIVALLPLAGIGLENRFIYPWQMLILAAGCIANHLIALQGFYVLSRKARPFIGAALTGFGSTAIAVWMGGYYYSTTGIVVGYTLTTACITLPLHTLAYLAYRRIGGGT